MDTVPSSGQLTLFDLHEPPPLDPLYGFCHCGCGRHTTLAVKTKIRDGLRKGMPVRFLPGHSGNKARGPRGPVITRFWQKVERPQSLIRCWLWCGAMKGSGYGRMMVEIDATSGRRIYRTAHRISWELAHGPIPPGFWVLHKCDNPLCVRPSHLFLGTVVDNVQDMVAKGRHPCGKRSGSRLHPERLPRGERHYLATLTAPQVRAIRQAYRVGNVSYSQLAGRYGVGWGVIRDIITGATWKHVL